MRFELAHRRLCVECRFFGELMAKSKKNKSGRPSLGRIPLSIKMLPGVIAAVDKYVAAYNKKGDEDRRPLNRSEFIEIASVNELKRRR